MLKLITNFIFPKICLICGSERKYLCNKCIHLLKKPEFKCFRCDRKNPFGLYCAICKNPLLPNRIIAAFAYEGQLKEIIHQYKYEDAYILSKDLARGLFPIVKKLENYRSYSLTFIPLSLPKIRSRGYNQAKLLADEVGKKLKLEIVDLMERLPQDETQVISQTKAARKKNIRGTFKIKKTAEVPEKIILIDDVVTTGATAEEATKILKKAGAKKVIVIALAMGAA